MLVANTIRLSRDTMRPFRLHSVLIALTTAASVASAQDNKSAAPDCAKVVSDTVNHATMNHAAHAAALATCTSQVPTSSGQAAFAAMSEIVRMLKADPNTDWSRVN